MDQVTHGPLAVQQRPRRLRKAFLPYVYISALSIFTPWENTQFSMPFVLKGAKEWTSLHRSLSPTFKTGEGQRGHVSFWAKFGNVTLFISTTLCRIRSLTHSYSSVQVLAMNRFKQWVLHSLSFRAIHWNSHALSISSRVARETKWGLVSLTVCVCALET